jgi:hypothetical protein
MLALPVFLTDRPGVLARVDGNPAMRYDDPAQSIALIEVNLSSIRVLLP